MSGMLASIGSAITRARNFTLNALFLLVVVLVLMGMLRSCGTVGLAEQQALVIDPAGAIVEHPSPMPALPELALGGLTQETLLSDLTRAIEKATEDDRIPLILLNLEALTSISINQAQVLGQSLEAFKESGKPVVAYGTYYTQGQYLAASYASELYMHPYGQTLLSGYSMYSLYFKELLDSLKVKVHMFRAGEFKSAVEPFTANGMSEASRSNNQPLIDSLWETYAHTAAANRSMSAEAFSDFVSAFDEQVVQAGGDMALALIEGHLVDELLTQDELNARLVNRVGEDDEGNYRSVTYDDYLSLLGPDVGESVGDRSAVAVIYASGAILMDNPGGGSFVSAREIREQIRDARYDDSVAALVLRVNSPGGSSFASEVIRQELELTQLAGKPVVVSMADVAASGGYWIAATADRILAHSSTVTGSIGVFSIIPSFEESLASVGIQSDGIDTAPLSGTYNPARALSQPMQRILQASVDSTYQKFVHLVARGREMSPDQVEALAQGQVWSGEHALANGLVDALGDQRTAIETAAELAGLHEWSVRQLSPPVDPRAELLSSLLEDRSARSTVAQSPFATMYRMASHINFLLAEMSAPGQVYALCESCEVTLRQ